MSCWRGQSPRVPEAEDEQDGQYGGRDAETDADLYANRESRLPRWCSGGRGSRRADGTGGENRPGYSQ